MSSFISKNLYVLFQVLITNGIVMHISGYDVLANKFYSFVSFKTFVTAGHNIQV